MQRHQDAEIKKPRLVSLPNEVKAMIIGHVRSLSYSPRQLLEQLIFSDSTPQ